MTDRSAFVSKLEIFSRPVVGATREGLKRLTDSRIIELLNQLLASIEDLKATADDLSKLTWFTTYRAEENPFDPFSARYKR